jgi:hypothetical protein
MLVISSTAAVIHRPIGIASPILGEEHFQSLRPGVNRAAKKSLVQGLEDDRDDLDEYSGSGSPGSWCLPLFLGCA